MTVVPVMAWIKVWRLQKEPDNIRERLRAEKDLCLSQNIANVLIWLKLLCGRTNTDMLMLCETYGVA